MTIPEFNTLIKNKMAEKSITCPVYFNHYPVGVNIPIIVYDANDEGFGADLSFNLILILMNNIFAQHFCMKQTVLVIIIS